MLSFITFAVNPYPLISHLGPLVCFVRTIGRGCELTVICRGKARIGNVMGKPRKSSHSALFIVGMGVYVPSALSRFHWLMRAPAYSGRCCPRSPCPSHRRSGSGRMGRGSRPRRSVGKPGCDHSWGTSAASQ